MNLARIKKGIEKYTAFWAHQENVDLNNAVFLIKIKKISPPLIWEKDFLKQQMAQPWQNIGTAIWINQVCIINLSDKMILNN